MNILRNVYKLTPTFNIMKRNFSFSMSQYSNPFNTIINPTPILNPDFKNEIEQDTIKPAQIEFMNKRNKLVKRKRAKRKYKKDISLRYR
jgi:hypothetical protein